MLAAEGLEVHDGCYCLAVSVGVAVEVGHRVHRVFGGKGEAEERQRERGREGDILHFSTRF